MAESFPKVAFWRWGYDPGQVDKFFDKAKYAYMGGMPAGEFSSEQVRLCAFDLVLRGYQISAVDGALSRLEAAFIARDRADHVNVNGEEAWLDHVAQEATKLYPRLTRPAGQRFAHPTGRERGYKASEVDQFLDRLSAYFDNRGEVSATEVRSVLFSRAKGAKAYAEGPVDAYLARVSQILLSVE